MYLLVKELILSVEIWHINQQVKKFLGMLKFCLLLIILAIIINYLVYFFNVFLIIVNLFLLPQIIHVAYKIHYVQLNKFFVFGFLSTMRFSLQFSTYINILKTVIIIILLYATQVIFYNYQCTKEPRFFLTRKIKAEEICVICTCVIETKCVINILNILRTQFSFCLFIQMDLSKKKLFHLSFQISNFILN
ncbi:unnamed protein product [Paramecium sonneborni]|uniref:Transmembrane protein n=1 Tax=Paramecium sonneborni TaxID=65129 RepID=A0A8S1QYM0_9CILI|nr:unnamed protein product [Paramecium sonneborni]